MTRDPNSRAPYVVLQTTLALAFLAFAGGASLAVDNSVDDNGTAAYLSEPKYTIYSKMSAGEKNADRETRPPIWQQLARPELAKSDATKSEAKSELTKSEAKPEAISEARCQRAKPECSMPRCENSAPDAHHFNGKKYLHAKSPTFGGHADYYSDSLHGHRTASGEPYDRNKLTAAHKHLPLGTHLRVVNRHNGKSCILKVNDRGPFTPGRVLDVSMEAARQLGLLRGGRMVDCYVVTRVLPVTVPEKGSTAKAQSESPEAVLKSKLADKPLSSI